MRDDLEILEFKRTCWITDRGNIDLVPATETHEVSRFVQEDGIRVDHVLSIVLSRKSIKSTKLNSTWALAARPGMMNTKIQPTFSLVASIPN